MKRKLVLSGLLNCRQKADLEVKRTIIEDETGPKNITQIYKPSVGHYLGLYLDARTAAKTKLIHKQFRKVEIPHEILNVFPNDGPVKMFFDSRTSKFTWEDTDAMIPGEMKKNIELSMTLEGAAKSNDKLFTSIPKNYKFLKTARLFIIEVLNLMSRNVQINLPHGEYNQYAYVRYYPHTTTHIAYSDYHTPLMLVSYYNAKEAVATLISRGVKIDDQDKYGRTALMYAAHQDSVESFELLLKNGADIDVKERMEGLRSTNTWKMLKDDPKYMDDDDDGDFFRVWRNSGVGQNITRYVKPLSRCAELLENHKKARRTKCVIV